MDTIHDYIRFIATSMLVDLNDAKVDRIADKLITNGKYKEMLYKLEDMIIDKNKARWRKK